MKEVHFLSSMTSFFLFRINLLQRIFVIFFNKLDEEDLGASYAQFGISINDATSFSRIRARNPCAEQSYTCFYQGHFV